MTTTPPGIPRLTLARALYGFVVAGGILAAIGLAFFLSANSRQVVDEVLDTAVRVRTEAAGNVLARMLASDWDDLKFLGDEAARSGEARLGGLMDGMKGDGGRISWIGLAGTDGIVRQATGDLLVGQDVSARPWFQNGLREPFAGDLHEAVLLAQLVETGEEMPRFIDLALPVTDAAGDTTGVIGAHINFAWAAKTLAELSSTLALDLFLLDANGGVILSTADADLGAADLQILRAAASGVASGAREVWPDGHEYFSAVVPRVAYADLPNFGWRVVGRLDSGLFRAGLETVSRAVLWSIFGLTAALAILSASFVLFFIRPIEALADTSYRIAEGEDIYPPEYRQTRETALLSAAVARLQSRRSVSDRK